MLFSLLSEHLSIDERMLGEESLTEASGEGWHWLSNSDFSSGNLGGVSRNEMVHGLLSIEFRDWRHNSEGIAGEENNVLWMASDSWQLAIADMLERIANTSVSSLANVIVVDHTWSIVVTVIYGVLDNGSEFHSIKNIGLFLTGKTISLGVAASFDVEHVGVSPHMLIITNQLSLRVTRQGGLTGSGKAKENGSVSLSAKVSRAMHGESTTLRHVVVHDTKDSFLHLSSVGGSKNDEFLLGEVHIDGGLVSHVFQMRVRHELS